MTNNFNNYHNQTDPYFGFGFDNFQRHVSHMQQMIPGRVVNNLDEITPQEVPMDGSVSLFPQKTGFNNQAVTNKHKKN